MEKCTFCIQRIRRSKREASANDQVLPDGHRELNPACVNSCPTGTLTFGDFNDPDSKISKIKDKELNGHGRGYHMLEHLGTHPNVIYLKKVDEKSEAVEAHH